MVDVRSDVTCFLHELSDKDDNQNGTFEKNRDFSCGDLSIYEY